MPLSAALSYELRRRLWRCACEPPARLAAALHGPRLAEGPGGLRLGAVPGGLVWARHDSDRHFALWDEPADDPLAQMWFRAPGGFDDHALAQVLVGRRLVGWVHADLRRGAASMRLNGRPLYLRPE